MSAFGTKRTFLICSRMSAFGGKADMPIALQMSAFDPKRTCVTKLNSKIPAQTGPVEDTPPVRQSSYSIEMSFPV